MEIPKGFIPKYSLVNYCNNRRLAGKEDKMNDKERFETEIPEEEIQIVTLVTDDGAEENFWHVLTFPYERVKYAALVPEAQIDDEEPEVIFVRVDHDSEGGAYTPVENPVLLGELFEEFASLMDEQIEEE